MNITSFNCHNVTSIVVKEPALLPDCGGTYHADIIITFPDESKLTVTAFSTNHANLIADAWVAIP